MKTACFIPIKAHSERVSGKNLRILNGKKLYERFVTVGETGTTEGLHKQDDALFVVHVLTEIGHIDADFLSIRSGS